MQSCHSLHSLRPPVAHLKRGVVEKVTVIWRVHFLRMKNKHARDAPCLRNSPELKLMWSTRGLSLRYQKVFTSRDPCPLDTSTPHDEGCSLGKEHIRQVGGPLFKLRSVEYLNEKRSHSTDSNISQEILNKTIQDYFWTKRRHKFLMYECVKLATRNIWGLYLAFRRGYYYVLNETSQMYTIN